MGWHGVRAGSISDEGIKCAPIRVQEYSMLTENTYVHLDRTFDTWCLFLFTGVMGEYEPKIEVQFPETVPAEKGTTVKLECFALGK